MSLELIGVIAQGVVALSALLVVWQVVVTKQHFVLNSRRESVKYASQLVKSYLEEIIPKQNENADILDSKNFTYWDKPVDLTEFTRSEMEGVENKELRKHCKYAANFLHTNRKDALFSTVDVANLMESFAVPFVAEVADEKVAFEAIGVTFCKAVNRRYFLYCMVREKEKTSFTYYENTIKLYRLWSARLHHSELENSFLKVQSELEESAKNSNSIKPIGT